MGMVCTVLKVKIVLVVDWRMRRMLEEGARWVGMVGLGFEDWDFGFCLGFDQSFKLDWYASVS